MQDSILVATVILNTPGAIFRTKRLARNKVLKPLAPERLESALVSLVNECGLEKLPDGRYTTKPERLTELVMAAGIEGTPAQAYERLMADAAEVETGDATPTETPEQPAENGEAAIPAEAEQPPRKKLATPKIGGKSKLESILEKIDSIEAEKVYVGEEREKVQASAFERAADVVSKINEGILRLSEKTTMVSKNSIISIKRIFPVGSGVGGIEMTTAPYKGKVTTIFRRAWSDQITDHWLKKLQKDVERSALQVLESITNRVMKKRK